MKKRSLILSVLFVSILGTLAACGGDDSQVLPQPLDPTVASLTLKAANDVNPNSTSQPSPVVVRVFQLTNVTAFQETDLFQLQESASSALGDELVASEEFVLAPGQTIVYQRELPDDARFLGVAAAFRDLSAGRWRSFYAVPRAKTSLLEAEIAGTAVTMRKAGL